MRLNCCTFVSSGSAIMQDGSTIRNGYPLDLDNVTQGCRIGMIRTSEGNLHYYYNGIDQGVACENLPPGKIIKFYFVLNFFCKQLFSYLVCSTLYVVSYSY